MASVLVGAVVSVAVYSLVAVGFSVIFSVTRIFHFAHAVIFVLAGYVAFTLTGPLGILPAAVVGTLAGIACALSVELFVYRPIEKRRGGTFTLLMASIGIELFLVGVIGSIWGTAPANYPTSFGSALYALGPFHFSSLDLATVVTAVLLISAFYLWLQRSTLGQKCRAVSDNPAMARALGIGGVKVSCTAVVVGTLVSCPAAVLLGLSNSLAPTMGETPLFIAFAAVLVGGIYSIPGTILGVSMLEIISAFVSYWTTGEWALAITFGITLAFMLWKPSGIFGKIARSTAL